MNGPAGLDSTESVYERIQEALEAVGAVDRAVGNAGSDGLRQALTEDLNAAVVALQSARDKIVRVRGTGSSPP